MKSKLMIFGAVAGLALAQASLAQEVSKPLASVGNASATGKISCHGITSVPMTLDAEQALPMNIIATLNCGEEVAILSDFEGYTVGVRTADGKTGYVARMYVAKPAPAPAKPPSHADSANLQNGVARWQPGTKGSEQFNGNGLLVESLTVNGVTVQVSLQDTGWKLRADVAVANDGANHVSVTPSHFTLDEIRPTAKSLAYQDPKHLAKAVNHQILWTAASAAPAAGPQISNAAYHMPVYSSALSPNYLAQHEAAVQLVSEHKAEFNPSSQINVVALSDASLQPSQEAAGAVWFERDAKPKELLLRVPVGDVVFEFPLSFDHNK
jgi:hypothetical protein